MAKRRPPPGEIEQVSFDMTPMIDCTFQLIIFFMLIMDMSKAQLEPLTLPSAKKAIKEKFADTTMLVINVMKDGSIKINGKTFWKPAMGDEMKKLEDEFEGRRQNKLYQEVQGKTEWVKYPVLIRCDRSTHFEHLQKILMIATHHGGVTRVQLGAKQEARQ
jgi:biopolymer transport protein ExbD